MRWWDKPALKALLIQLASASLILVLIGSSLLFLGVEASVSALTWTLAQSVLTLLFARLLKQEVWWLAIHFVFPLAVFFTLQLDLSNHLYLIAFLVSLGLFWSSFSGRVPYYPSSKQVWDEVLNLLPQDKKLKMVDIGSGLGGLVIYAARRRPTLEVTGIETAPFIWAYSQLRATLTRSRASFILGNYDKLDLGEYDVVFAYLSPAAMPGLMKKSGAQMKNGSLFISHEFPFPDLPPTWIIDYGENRKPSYVYQM